MKRNRNRSCNQLSNQKSNIGSRRPLLNDKGEVKFVFKKLLQNFDWIIDLHSEVRKFIKAGPIFAP